MRNVISWVARAAKCPGRGDSGAIGVIVAVLLGSVLLGMGALVIDVGELYNEHAQLLGTADAAAAAVAKSCITGSCTPLIASSYARANVLAAGRGSVNISLVCGSGTLGPCPAHAGTRASCPAAPGGIGYVDIYASTPATGRSALLPPVFASVLPGIHHSGASISVCVQASWGAPAAAQATAFTISQCAWQSATVRNPLFSSEGGTQPAGSVPPPSSDTAFHLLSRRRGACSGAQMLFAWAADQTGSCSLAVNGSRFLGWTGTPLPSCLTELASAQASRIPIVIPVFPSVSRRFFGTQSYQVYGFADFVVTGYNLAGISAPDWLNPADGCSGSVSCIDGYFTLGIVPSTGSFGGRYLGATMIDLTH